MGEKEEAKGRLYVDDYKTRTYQDGSSHLDFGFTFSGGKLSVGVSGALPKGTVSTELERVEIFGLKRELVKATLKMGTKTVDLPKPSMRALPSRTGSARFAAMLKVSPWVDMREQSEWS